MNTAIWYSILMAWGGQYIPCLLHSYIAIDHVRPWSSSQLSSWFYYAWGEVSWWYCITTLNLPSSRGSVQFDNARNEAHARTRARGLWAFNSNLGDGAYTISHGAMPAIKRSSTDPRCAIKMHPSEEKEIDVQRWLRVKRSVLFPLGGGSRSMPTVIHHQCVLVNEKWHNIPII